MKRAACVLAVSAALAGCSRGSTATPEPALESTCHEGLLVRDCARLGAMALPSELPRARGNSRADDMATALLGFHVFFDVRFSKGQTVRCESCHSVDYAFSDNQRTPIAGLGHGVRNAPTLLNAARYASFLWDGRADSLWSQPLFAFENPAEMGFTRLELVRALKALHGKEYENAFGRMPDFSDGNRFPPQGAPGDAAYDAMTASDQALVDGVVANLGKALEAYIRKIAAGPSAFDRYLASADAATTLTAQQERGMVVFATAGCLDCHGGPAFSDGEFHVLGVPAVEGEALDEGRSPAVVGRAVTSPFSARGPYFEGDPDEIIPAPAVLGGFRTPSLRNLSRSAPYGHSGAFATLEAVVDFHLQGGGSDPTTFAGSVDAKLVKRALSPNDRAALVEFLKALDGDYPALPWGQWPNGNG
jgi:cytochrome c peroxidase